MWLEAEKARNFNAVVWVLGEVNGYHYVDLFFNLLSDKSTDRRADITHSVMAVLRKDFIGFTRLPCPFGRGDPATTIMERNSGDGTRSPGPVPHPVCVHRLVPYPVSGLHHRSCPLDRRSRRDLSDDGSFISGSPGSGRRSSPSPLGWASFPG